MRSRNCSAAFEKGANAEQFHALGQRGLRRRTRRARQRLLFENDGTEPRHLPRPDMPARRIKEALVLADDGGGQFLLDVLPGNLGGGEDALRGGASGEIGDDDHLRIGEPLRLRDLSAAAVGHDESSAPATLQGDSIRESMEQQAPGMGRPVLLLRFDAVREPPGQPARRFGAFAALAAEA
jgi:hypothetical protein